jgi:hypothetical protein
MTQPAPPILPYAAKQHHKLGSSFVIASALLAFVFAASFWCIETATSNIMLFHFQILGPIQPGTLGWAKMEDHHFEDLMIEFIWSLPATVIVFTGLMTFGPRNGARLSVKSFLATVAGAIIYSWARWSFYLAHFKVTESTDFCIAMMLAALAGVGTSFVRSK